MKFTVQAVSKSKTQIKNFETEYEAKAFIKKCGCSGFHNVILKNNETGKYNSYLFI